MAFIIEDDTGPPAPTGRFVIEDAPAQKADPRIGQPEELSFGEKLMSGVALPKWLEDALPNRGSRVGGWMQGMADMQVGGVQTLANQFPDSTGIPQFVNKAVSDENAKYEAARAAEGRSGADLARVAGNVTNPVNLLLTRGAAAPESAAAAAGQGAGFGALGGIFQPVYGAENGGFWKQKAGQAGLGAVTGGALGPGLYKVGEAVVRRLGSAPNLRISDHDVDGAIADALKEAGQSLDDVGADQLQALRQQVAAALQKGQNLDAAAALRKADFEALDMNSTLGQITRDPMQFARERNLRGVEGVGEPLTATFADQGQKLPVKLPAASANNAYQAGVDLSQSLKATDDKLNNHVNKLYAEARAAAGKDLDIPLQGLASDYADVLRRFGDRIPAGVRNAFEDLGLLSGTQKRLFNFEEADNVLKTINANVSNDPGVNNALRELRGALRKSLEGVDSSGGPFAPAVRAAAERFKMHDAIPALKAASRGTVAPDDFVRRFVVNGKTNDVKGLAQVLQQSDPAAYQEARAQLGAELRRAGWGENAAGDAPFAPTRYMATIRRIGVDKLSAFFNPAELQDILRVGRVGTYIHQAPNAAAVSSSNSNAGVVNVLTKLPGLGRIGSVINGVTRPLQQSGAVRESLAANVPTTDAPLSEMQGNYLAYLLSLGGIGLGGLAARGQ